VTGIGRVFTSSRVGLNEAVAHAKGHRAGMRELWPEPADVAAAPPAPFRLSVTTLRHGEPGDGTLQRPAKGLCSN
jgi:hypothetical protein